MIWAMSLMDDMMLSEEFCLLTLTLGSTAPVGKPTGHNENSKLECPWVGEPTSMQRASAGAEVIFPTNCLFYGDKIGW